MPVYYKGGKVKSSKISTDVWAKEVFLPWLNSKEWNIKDLAMFLEQDVSSYYYEFEMRDPYNSYRLIVDAFIFVGSFEKKRKFWQFKTRLAALFADFAASNPYGQNQKTVLINALKFCIQKPQKEIFFYILKDLLHFEKNNKYLTKSEVDAYLYYAIAQNQVDHSFMHYWLLLLSKKERAFWEADLGLKGITGLPGTDTEEYFQALVTALEVRYALYGDRGLPKNANSFYKSMIELKLTSKSKEFYLKLIDTAKTRGWGKNITGLLQAKVEDIDNPPLDTGWNEIPYPTSVCKFLQYNS